MPHVHWIYYSFGHLHWDYNYFFNYIFPPVCNKIPLNGYLYLLIAGAVVAAICLQPRYVFSWMLWCASGGLILALLFQVHWQQQYWEGEIRTYASQDDESRTRALWPEKNGFFDFFLSQAPLGASCYAVSEFNPRYIRYALYPKVMVADQRNIPFNCVVVFKMKDPLKYVPSGFTKVLWYDRWDVRQSLMALKGD